MVSINTKPEMPVISRVETCIANPEISEQLRQTTSNQEMEILSRIKTISANPDLVELTESKRALVLEP